MKNHLRFALAGALALAALVSCNKEASKVENNPTFDELSNTVKTQFVLSVATANTPTTKMTAANTQATLSEKFRGMEEVSLLAYELDYNVGANGGGSHVFDLSTDPKATAKRSYALGQLLSYDEITESNSRRVMELALPVGTNTLLFYGKAPKGSGTSKTLGGVTMDVQDNAKNTSFTIDKRMTAENQTIFNETTDLFATCMNMLSNAGLKQYTAGSEGSKLTRDLRYAFYWPMNDEAQDILDVSSMDAVQLAALPANGDPGTGAHASQTFHIGSVTWPELGAKYILNNDGDPSNDVTLRPLEEILGQAHTELCTIRSVGGNNELRAASGDAMQMVVTDIYNVAERVSNSTASFWEGQAAILLARRIKDIILTSFNAGTTPLSYQSVTTIKAAIAQYVYGKETSNYSHVNDLQTFPGNIDLPKGAAIITYNESTHQWSYLTSIPAYGMGGGSQDIAKYLFPAELMYFGNSPVRVTNDSHETAHYPATVSTWDNDATWAAGELAGATGWKKDGVVSSTTRSVAMQKDINYGTALLKSTVRYGATTLEDNNAAIQADRSGATEPNAEITVAEDSFKLTGVLVGGLTNVVGWNYVNKGGSFDHIVYDSDIPNTKIPTPYNTKSDPVYTLVWDNWNSALANDAQSPVYVALEIQNNAKDFWGNANRVRKGGTFYLIGKLDPDGMSFPTRTNTNYNLPPYNDDATGTTREAPRVFIQDFMTSADFIIGQYSLQKAYVTVPDLRSSEISLGLSVDIKWETGLAFSDVVLGNF